MALDHKTATLNIKSKGWRLNAYRELVVTLLGKVSTLEHLVAEQRLEIARLKCKSLVSIYRSASEEL